jgi:hypothetical protein
MRILVGILKGRVQLEGLRAASMTISKFKITALWDVTLYGLIHRYNSLHLHARRVYSASHFNV